MLYKNIIRTIWTKPLQFFSLVILIAMSSLTYVTLHNAIYSLEYFLNEYTTSMNQEDFLVVLNPPKESDLKELIKAKGIGVNELLSSNTDELMRKYEYDIVDYYDHLVSQLSEKYDATIEGRFYRDVTFDVGSTTNTFRVIKETDSVNLTYVIEGELPVDNHEIAIFEQYANANHLNIGDEITIKDKTFKISGFVAVPDYIYPIFNYDSPLYEPDRESIVIVTDAVYDWFPEKQWVLYSGYFNDGVYSSEAVSKLSKESSVAYALGKDLNVRISTVTTEMDSNKLLATAFSNVILLLSVFVIVLVLRKRLDADRVQIGILKAMGYNNLTISLNYVIYPLLAAILGTWIGFFIGSGASVYLANYYVGHYVIPNVTVAYKMDSILNGIVYPIILVTVVSFIILLILLNKRPLQLMKEHSHLKTSKFSVWISKRLAPFSFETRFQYSLAFRNVGKVMTLFVIVFIASVFLVFASISISAVDRVVEKAFGDINYAYQVKYNKTTNDPLKIDESPFIEQKIDLFHATVKNGETVYFDKATPFFMYGIDAYNFINPLHNAKGEDITLLSKDGLIINEFIARAYSLSIGDKMTFMLNKKLITRDIVEIVDHYNGPMMYTSIEDLGDILNYDRGIYNGKWSNERPTTESGLSYTLSVKDLQRNLEIAVEMINLTLGVMIGVAIVLGFIIMILIANFVIDENHKQISILKVMGYTDREVSKMVLRIYFPFIIVAYLVSVPLTIFGLDYLMSLIAARLPFALPTEFTFVQCLTGLGVILFTYFIALTLSKRQLKNISLQEVLKY